MLFDQLDHLDADEDAATRSNWDTQIILSTAPGETTHKMGLREAREVINATAYASYCNTPLNAMLTVAWRFSERFDARCWLDGQGRLLDKASRWLNRNDVPVAYVWVREHGRQHGPHSHVLLHLPHKHWNDFSDFVTQTGGFTDHPSGTGRGVVITGGAYGMNTRAMRSGAVRYILKTIDPRALCRTVPGAVPVPVRQALGLDDRGGRSLPVSRKSAGSCHGIGPRARALAGWQELHGIEQLHDWLHP